jgi:methylornithine synthase
MDTKRSMPVMRGMLIEEGLLVGVGESLNDIADSILEMGQSGPDQMRVMSFVPQKGDSPGKGSISARILELKTIAVLRLVYAGC